MRVVAILAVHNEQRFIDACLSNLVAQGIEVHLIDHGSTDDTIPLAERYRGKGLVAIDRLPYDGVFSLKRQLRLKERIALSIDADWLIHVDADEILTVSRPDSTVAHALAAADRDGYNAVHFHEFTFVPTEEEPDHDHPEFQRTMRHYYFFQPQFPNRLIAWKRQDTPVDLVSSGGHRVSFAGLRMHPDSLFMRHYLYLSHRHALDKFVSRRFDPSEVEVGWFGWRAHLRPRDVRQPSAEQLRFYESDERLDPSEPRTKHFLQDETRRLLRFLRWPRLLRGLAARG